jgi:choline dehydrogenase-like flavoprotein
MGPFAFLQANGKEGSMTRALRAACVIVVLACAQSAVAEPSLKDLAARTEVRAIETLTLTDQQFLTGDKNGKSVAIAGQLRFPQGASGRLPVVILQQGSGGPNGGHELWAKTFNEMGIASFLGGTIMGTGAGNSVTNNYGQTHELPNLYVAGPGIFPTESASNPTYTIFALSLRGAEQMAANWSTVAGKSFTSHGLEVGSGGN